MIQVTGGVGKEALERRIGIGEEERHGTASRSVEAFQFDDIGMA